LFQTIPHLQVAVIKKITRCAHKLERCRKITS